MPGFRWAIQGPLVSWKNTGIVNNIFLYVKQVISYWCFVWKMSFYCLIYKPQIALRTANTPEFWPILSAILFTVNSEIFARGLFSRNFAYAMFRGNKTLARWQNHSVIYWYMYIMPKLRISKVTNMSFNAIRKNLQIYSMSSVQTFFSYLVKKVINFFSCSTELSRIFQFIPCQEGYKLFFMLNWTEQNISITTLSRRL